MTVSSRDPRARHASANHRGLSTRSVLVGGGFLAYLAAIALLAAASLVMLR
jgi:hypothetical protein